MAASWQAFDKNFIDCVRKKRFLTPELSLTPSEVGLNTEQLLDLFTAQCLSRHLDIQARRLREQGRSFYTIGSSGHEANAAVALALQATDMALLHYRSGAFMLQRARCAGYAYPIRDILLSLMAGSSEPLCSGRHKVWGSVALNVPPQTSTIASHLPKAVGAAMGIARAQVLETERRLPKDAIVLCSFGDASVNHASAQSAFNASAWMAYQHLPIPIVFVCEDNGLGISVPTPRHWIETRMQAFAGIHYVPADGCHLLDVYRAATRAVATARTKREPVFLHLSMVRLMGHAGSDIETQYRSQVEIAADEVRDPLRVTAQILLAQGILTQDEVIDRYLALAQQVSDEVAKLNQHDTAPLASRGAVMQSIVPMTKRALPPPASAEQRQRNMTNRLHAMATRQHTLGQLLNLALTDILNHYPQTVILGEDVGKKGGVYRITAELQNLFGSQRVFDTLLDEQMILGTAIGLSMQGLLPIPEIQFLAYVYNALDQLRGEAATLSFFSNGQLANPMVVRIPGLAYQKNFGGHFHNENALAPLRDMPGVIVACPSTGLDAVNLLHSCVQLAWCDQRVVLFIEPIALYYEKDLHEKGDNAWLSEYPETVTPYDLNSVGVYGAQYQDIVILTYGNGYFLSRKAQAIVLQKHHIGVKIVDIRWLAPLAIEAIIQEVRGYERILIVDEGRQSCSVSETLITLLHEHLTTSPLIKRITGADSFMPLGPAMAHVLVQVDAIVETMLKMANHRL